MIIISIAKIKEIAEDLDCDLQAFIHKSTGETLIMPDPKKLKITVLKLFSWPSG